MYIDRRTEILNALNEATRIMDNWIKGRQKGDSSILPDYVVAALKNAIVVCDGDVPRECREVCMQAQILGEELRAYLIQSEGKVNPNGSPVGSFWSPISKIVDLCSKCETPYVEQLESVKTLVEQKVSPDQIAFCIYGTRSANGGYIGPFVTPHGTADVGKINRAAKSEEDQEAVLGKDWYPPWKSNPFEQRRKDAAARVEAYRKLEEGPKRVTDPATVEELLNDGAYVQQIEKAKGVSRAEILAVADRIGIPAIDQPGWVNKTPAKTVPKTPEDAERLKSAIVQHMTSNPDDGSAEAVASLKEQGIETTSQQVAAIWKAHKDRQGKQQT